MSENEAKEWLRAISATQNESNHTGSLEVRKEALYIAIQALSEIQQYRAIGTVEEFKDLKEKSADIEKIIESIKQLPTQDFMGVLHIPRTATINRIKRGGNCELPEV